MTKPRTYQTQAIVIKKTRLGEADRILTLYTPRMGKIQGVAKGVRRPRAKLGGHLELLTLSQVTLARGKNIDTIIGSQVINAFQPLKEDLELVSCACYIIELVNQFTAEETADERLFALLLETLDRLPGRCPSLVLRHFEMCLLQLAGYRPELVRCVVCRLPIGTPPGGFAPSAGGIICPACQSVSHHYGYPVSVADVSLLRLLQETEWISIEQCNPAREQLDNLELLLRRYIRYLLEREIKSVAWLDCLHKS